MIEQSARLTEGQAGVSISSIRVSKHWTNLRKGLRRLAVKALFHSEFFFLIAGFLLGRAVILTSLTPFTVPFFALVFWLRRKRKGIVAFSAVAGACTVSPSQAFFSFVALLLFTGGWHLLIKQRSARAERWLPALVFLTSAAVRLLCQAAFTLTLSWTDGLTAMTEAALAYLVTLIFMQSVPLLSVQVNHKLFKNEEIICFVILVASVLAGTVGWQFDALSINHVLVRYLLLLFALAGGAAIGSTVGVVMGLILGLASVSSLYQISLLAFSGVLGGLLKEAGKLGVAAGLMIATLLISLYGGGYASLSGEAMNSFAAILLLLITPKSVVNRMASFIPGTSEYYQEQQQYVRKLRDATIARVEQFSSLFQALATSFNPPVQSVQHVNEKLADCVKEAVCRKCFKKQSCWVRHADQTRQLINELSRELKRHGTCDDQKLRMAWRVHCAKSDRTLTRLAEEQRIVKMRCLLNCRIKESRRLVADQLHGVSQVMENFAKQMQKERGLHDWQEDIILKKLNHVGLRAESVEIYSLESGTVDIEVLLPLDGYGACEKIVAPLLSDILGEAITVSRKDPPNVRGGPVRAIFASAYAMDVETGAATAALGGAFVSGDNYSFFDIGTGKYALAISDGMGSGERAHAESRAALQLLTKVLKSGIPETLAIKSINSILLLRSTEEIFATLDLALIDLQNGHSKFLKIGSNPSFIKRGRRVFMQDGGNLPIGMIEKFDVEVHSEQLKPGDLLIMMSDGLFDSVKQADNKEAWIQERICALETSAPQEVADLLLEQVIRQADGAIRDDMTVIVARVKQRLPQWSSIIASTSLETMDRAE